MASQTPITSPSRRATFANTSSSPKRSNSGRFLRPSAIENGSSSSLLPSNSHLHLKGYRPTQTKLDSLDATTSSTTSTTAIPNASSLHAGVHPTSSTSSSTPTTSSSSFFVMFTGQIESVRSQFSSSWNDNLYCRYSFSYGPDWEIVHGVSMGLSQIGRPSLFGGGGGGGGGGSGGGGATCSNDTIVWNFPIEISFQSTNPSGWPRLAISVYGFDFFGRDVVRGYASLLLPITPGQHTKYLNTYRPISGSKCQQFVNWMMGTNPEYYDSRMVNRSEGRSGTRVVCEDGLVVKVSLVVTRKDFEAFGYAS